MEKVYKKAINELGLKEENKIGLEESKKIELDILLDFVQVCNENNLKYYLAYGTLIGAIRHKGFIPWDDDIDVQMPRDDYNKLIEIYNSKKKKDYYELVNPYDKKARHTFVKIIDNRTVKIENPINYKNGYLGMDIDVFPIDGAPCNINEFEKYYNKLISVYRFHTYSILYPFKNYKCFLASIGGKILSGGYKHVLNKAKKIHNQYPYKNSKYVASIECTFDTKDSYVEKKYFGEGVLVDFEGYKLNAPEGYDYILTKIYGDYMTPPENPVTHHSNISYWK